MIKTKFLILFFSLIFYSISFSDSFKLATDNWEPYEYLGENNKIVGFSTEVIQNILKKMTNKKIENNIYPWVRVENLITFNKVDAIYSASYSKKRAKFCYFPDEELINSKWVFIIRKEDINKIKFDSFNDFNSLNIGVVKDYAYTDDFWNYLKSHKKLSLTTTDENLLNLLHLKRFDLIVCESKTANSIIKKLKIENKVYFLEKPLKEVGLYIIFNKNRVSKPFVDNFSNKLKEYKKTDEFKKIYNKYFE